MLTVGSLFSGIGGLELGLERAGMKTIWQVERDPYARQVLAKNFPGVPCHEDVRRVGAACLARPDVLAGGFPCQPHSSTGKQLGSADERDMWPEVVRLVRDLEPRWVLVENVARIRSTEGGRFFGSMLRDLAALGLDAEWDCLPASAFGAHHERDRLFLVAYPAGLRGEARRVLEASPERRASLQHRRLLGVADARRGLRAGERLEREPGLARLVHGVPDRLDRLRCGGNAVYPEVGKYLGELIAAADATP